MPFDHVDFFCFAQWLCDTKPDPPSKTLLRTIVNRAYYAALISASKHTGTPTTGLSGHENVIDALHNINSAAANKLRALKKKRVEADYKESPEISQREAEISLQDSRIVLAALNKAPISLRPYTNDFLDHSRFLKK